MEKLNCIIVYNYEILYCVLSYLKLQIHARFTDKLLIKCLVYMSLPLPTHSGNDSYRPNAGIDSAHCCTRARARVCVCVCVCVCARAVCVRAFVCACVRAYMRA